MHYRIRHRTLFTFGAPVFLEPHMLRFFPRTDPSQRVESFEMRVDPEPVGMSHGIDLGGNVFALAWFDEMTTHLTIDAQSAVSTSRANPFDYLIAPEGLERLPWSTTDPAAELFLRRKPGGDGDPVASMASELAAREASVAPFLAALNDRLHRTVSIVIREEGEPHSPVDTLVGSVGSCRDLAVLFVDACRSVGIPARFVSGYQEGDPIQSDRYLHAWAEAWIPGAGWRGYDPTLGLIVADRHVAVAAAADPRDAAPTQGTFRGSPPSVEMAFDLSVTRLGDAEDIGQH